MVAFHYRARATGKVNRCAVQPYSIIYGNRAFLVGHTELGSDLHLWRLANISGAPHHRLAPYPEFGIRSAGVRRALTRHLPGGAGGRGTTLRRAASEGRESRYLPPRPDRDRQQGRFLTVRFPAGGLDEICWHLLTWGTHVTSEHLGRRMAALATHHGT